MPYTQFTRDERISLAALLTTTHPHTTIANRLGKSTSAISREIARNNDSDGAYRGASAHKRAMARRKAAKEPTHKIRHDRRIRRHIIRALKKHWSPEQIAGRLKHIKGYTVISHETIYTWIYSERPDLKKLLRCTKDKYRRKRGTKAREKARDTAKVRRIDTRPAIVETRTRIGDWEGDTVIGKEKTKRIMTNVERMSGYGLADLLHEVSARIMRARLETRFKTIPLKHRHTYTYDNGTEIGVEDRDLEQRIGMDVYRAYPYHSWERGTNENWNGLLREFFPKGMFFGTLTQDDVDRAVQLINHRPRKRLGYLTPYEVFVQGKQPPILPKRERCTSR